MLKYESELAAIEFTAVKCPADAAPCDGVAYRYVHQSVPVAEDFLPVPIESNGPPRRIQVGAAIEGQALVAEENYLCNQWALSMFETEDHARKFFKAYLRKRKTHTHIAAVQLRPIDGLGTKPNTHLHFNFHEYQAANLVAQVVAITAI
ncbi:hypothetical protein [Hymenobacter crusticola]|uniref:Uncharacterized protein n=1 Tax=Hymenobacter crusticola TaxID=1770526 RepID=A0A243W8T1_9BACT|nr:hypothetical protein [Hymenobacter crusticola]OUJ69929.1 hypothetical protein BXP70_25650 [Hymenobacter crusticola]